MPEEIQQLKSRIDLLETTLFILVKSDKYLFSKHISLFDGLNISVSSGTGTKFGTAIGQKIGFWNATPIVQQTNGVNLTNNVASGGTDDQIDNFTDLSTYSNDALAIRRNIYQLARKLKIVNDALRTMGLMS